MNFKLPNTSNMVFIYPILIGVLGGLYLGVVLSAGLIIASFAYHNSKESHYLRFDQFFSWTSIFYNLYLCYLFKFNYFPFGVALLFLAVGLFCYFRKKDNKYDIYHTLWHISCAGITCCCYLGYLLYR